jgi:uncharacterized repeat protein (TIGR01451 family)/uncharacterized delta-60 repeat protein
MRRLRISSGFPGQLVVWLGLYAWLGLASAGWAQTSFNGAQVLTGIFGSVTNDNTGVTPDPGGPSNAGFPPQHPLWYKWVAPRNGEVTLTTLGSVFTRSIGDIYTGALVDTTNNMDTVLGVYAGADVAHLTQVAANDDLFPAFQENSKAFTTYNTPTGPWVGNYLYEPLFYGPSGLRFTAVSNTTYYVAVDSKVPTVPLLQQGFAGAPLVTNIVPTGPIVLNWAYHSSGVFRFATEEFSFDPLSGTPGLPMYQCTSTEGLPDDYSTFQTYYTYDPQGLLVTVTRVGGSSGRVLVDYTTVDGTAQADVDYTAVSGTLVFDDGEMSKTIRIPINYNVFEPMDVAFYVALSNPRLASQESVEVSPPQIDPTLAMVQVLILTQYAPVDDVEQYPDTSGNIAHDVFNFGKVHYYTPRDITNYWTRVAVWVYDTFPQNPNGDAATIHYRINNFNRSDRDCNFTSGELNNNWFPLDPGAEYATPTPDSTFFIHGTNSDFGNFNPNYTTCGGGTITFPTSDAAQAITFLVNNNALTEFNNEFTITLYRVGKNNAIFMPGEVCEAKVTILFDDASPPAGSVDEYYNADYGDEMAPAVSTTPSTKLAHPGADNQVYDLAVQPSDDKTIIVGQFGSYNTIGRNGIVRVNTDGSLDSSFDPGLGVDGFIHSIGLLPSGQMIVGGDFTSYDNNARSSLARVNSDGSLDVSFDPGIPGLDGTVWALAVQTNGQVIVCGDFTSLNGIPTPHVARLNADGSLDATFNINTNVPNDSVKAVVITANGRLIIGGDFTALGNKTANHIARLNPDGSFDTAFGQNVGFGLDNVVRTLALQPNGRILVGGDFGQMNLVSRNHIVRLTANGALDTSFDPGTGADDTVLSIKPQADGTIYVGGRFTSFNGTHRLGFARLFADGTLDTSFMDTAYNQYAGLPKRYFEKQAIAGDLNPDPKPFVTVSDVQSDGKVMIGGSFSRVGGGQANPKIRADPDYPTNIYNLDVYTEPKSRDGMRNRSNVARLVGGSTPGPGNISLLYTNYTINKSQAFSSPSLMRTNGLLGMAFANFQVLPATAQAGTDFIYNQKPAIYLSTWRQLAFAASHPYSTTRQHSDGMFGTNSLPGDFYGDYWFGYTPGWITVSVSSADTGNAGDLNALFQLANPSYADHFQLGGMNIPVGAALGRQAAPFVIRDDTKKTNFLGFASANFYVNENGTNATITVVRTNGTAGVASVHYSTANGTAIAGVNYTAKSGDLTFSSQVTTQTFQIPIIDDHVSEPGGLTVQLLLSSISGASYGLASATLNILDNDGSPGTVYFSPPTYTTNMSAPAVVISATRSGADRGTLTAQCITTNGTALNGVNYFGVTNTLVWNDLEFGPRYIVVPLTNSGVVGLNRTFGAYLANAQVDTTNASGILVAPSGATITLINDNSYGSLRFSASSYIVNENGGYITIPVIRTGGAAQTLTINYATADGPLAVSSGPSPNFVATQGTLTFGPGEVAKTFNVTILDDGITDGAASNFYFTVNLSLPNPPGVSGFPTNALVYIVDAEANNVPAGSPDTSFVPNPGLNGDVLGLALQADGKIVVAGNFTSADGASRNRIARYNADGTLDSGFLLNYPGVNGPISAVLVQSDGRVLLGGSFTSVNAVTRNNLARLATDGFFDTSFSQGSGANNSVFALVETFVSGTRRLLIGGSFNQVNGSVRQGLARLNNDSSLDSSFSPSLSINGTVYAIAVYPTNTIQGGKIVIGGDFTAINGVARNGIARMNADGTLDNSFNPGDGATNAVRAVAIQLDGRVLIGGSFTNFNGRPLNHIARLNVDGQVDTSFNVGAGADDTVNAIVVQADTRIMVCGLFSHANGVSRNRITRLLPDGTVDPAINFGQGANAFISSIALQPDGMMVIGGGFTSFDGQTRNHLARLYGGSLAGSGLFRFTSANYQVDENSTNAVLSVRRLGGTAGNMTVDFSTVGLTALPGVNFSNVNTTLYFPVGETFQSVMVPVLDDFQVTPDLLVSNYLSNPSPPSGLGGQPFALLTILNDDSTMSFSQDSFSVNQNVVGGGAFIDVVRQGSTRGTASVDFMTTTNGTAVAGVDFTPVTNTVTFQAGDTAVKVRIPILNNPLSLNDSTVTMQLSNTFNTLLSQPSQATLTIQSTNSLAGQLMFSQTNYVVGEGDGFLFATILRTNGHKGVVSVNFSTLPGSAPAGLKYVATNGSFTFNPGETSKTLPVRILEESQAEGNQNFFLVLSNVTGGATLLGPTNVPVTIVDDDVGLRFTSPFYVVPETAGTISVSVFRQNGTNSDTTVQYATTNLSAVAGVNYVGVTNTLVFHAGESTKSFTLQVLHDPRVTGDLSFGVNLYNPSVPAQVSTPSFATVVVLDNEAGINFANTNLTVFTNDDLSLTTNANYGVLKSSGTNLLITVVRSNVNTGTVGAICTTADGTAQQGTDYGTNWASLVFSNGVPFQTFTVQIVTNRLVRGDRTFSVYLTNATPTNIAQLVTPYVATVTITDDTAGLTFSSPIYSVSENASNAVITVLRNNWTNSIVSVNYFTSDGTGQANTNYLPASGTLLFTNGEMVKTFSVPVLDNHVVDGGHTVVLNLANAVGNAAILNPNPATLTIAETDGSLIIPAGVALISESGPVNGVIDTNETVTMLFGLRNANGTNTSSLVATLLATNGVANPSPPQNYGVLVARGPSASRSFTFTAAGTNGQTIQATFQLRDGSTVLSNAIFNFTLGKTPVTYSNTAAITISSLIPATPYPSVINVSNLNGLVVQATATLSNLSHTYPKDIDALLVSPTGQKTYLMAHCGGQIGINNVNLTFDDTTNSTLPYSAQITSGTYHPTSYAFIVPQFPVPPPPFPTNATAPPYATNLSTFNGGGPNGAWSLYVFDDTALNEGVIANGWTLSLNVSGPVAGAADLALAMTSAPASVVASSNVTYTLTVTNFGPAGATNVLVSDTLPSGTAFVSATPSTGIATNSGGVVSWSVGSLAKDARATLTVVVQANVAGTITNSAIVTTASNDPNPDDDIATAVTTITEPTADLILGMVGSEDPVLSGYNLTYTLTVTNQGPATAPVLAITDVLPPTVIFVSASPGASLNGNKVTFANLGNLPSGAQTSVAITVAPSAGGTLTNTATCSSAVTDPHKADNTASVKTVVEAFQLTVTHTPGFLTFGWPADAPNAYLESTPNLRPPTVWSPVTNPAPTTVGGQKTITLPIGNGTQFYRVHGANP